MYERIIKMLREGKQFSFMMEPELMQRFYDNFWYDTHCRVNNYHRSLKMFHKEKYGWDLFDGAEFGRPGDRLSKIIGMEYLFFCANENKMRKIKIDHSLRTVTVYQK